MTKAQKIAWQVFQQMSQADKDNYKRGEWLQGVSMMLVDDWADVKENDVLDSLEDLLNNPMR